MRRVGVLISLRAFAGGPGVWAGRHRVGGKRWMELPGQSPGPAPRENERRQMTGEDDAAEKRESRDGRFALRCGGGADGVRCPGVGRRAWGSARI